MHRREFLKQSGFLGASIAGGAVPSVTRSAGAAEGPARLPMPTIRLGSLEVSRLILGTNPFGGWAHQPGELGKEMKAYYTPERIKATLDEAAGHGITAVAGPPDDWWTSMYTEYLAKGGKLRTWIAQPHHPPEGIPEEIEHAVKCGAKAVFIQGHKVEGQFENGTFEVVRGWLELIRKLGVPAGMASHRTDCHLEAQKRKFPVDFYFQCMFNVAHGDSFEKGDPKKAVEVIRRLEKPVVAYKILGAGRVPPREGFEFAFRNIRPTDGVCVGIYTKDKPKQIEEDAELARRLSAELG
jgi:hypothetical protein